VIAQGDYARVDAHRIAYCKLHDRVAWEIRERHAHKREPDNYASEWKRHDYRARELLAKLRAMGKPAPAMIRDAAWHEAHGYALHNGIWINELLFRSQLVHEDAILAEREAHRIQKLELAALTYGPQTAVPFADIVDDLQFAEAAD
jgi:hypothetical protein